MPFTYAGTVEAYKLTSAIAATTEESTEEQISHSLFRSGLCRNDKVNWNNLDTAGLIFGKNYASGGVDYTLRAPSCGSGSTGSDDSERGTPQSNEWDAVLDKNSGYIQNWNENIFVGTGHIRLRIVASCGSRVLFGPLWLNNYATNFSPSVGFRPVLEVLNADTLGPDGLKAVTP